MWKFTENFPDLTYLELVSKELNHFGGIGRFSEIGHQGHWQVANKHLLMNHLSVSPVPNLRKMTQSPQSDLTPWILTVIHFILLHFYITKIQYYSLITIFLSATYTTASSVSRETCTRTEGHLGM